MNVRRVAKPQQAENGQKIRKHRPDYLIVLCMGLLMMFGLVIIYSIGPQRANVLNNAYVGANYSDAYFVVKQAVSLVLAFGFFLLATYIPIGVFKKLSGIILLTALGACLMLFLLGNLVHVESIAQCSLGACRWFNLGPLGGFQPAEFLKIALLLYLAVFLGTKLRKGDINDWSETLGPVLGVVGVAMLFVIVIQRDMGTGLAILVMAAAMLFSAGLSYKNIGKVGLLGLAVLLVLVVSAPHRMQRVTTFFAGDSSTVDDAGAYHISHAKMAIGSGGVFGVGIGNSVEATGYLPEAINDSVFAIIGEMFGFIGLVGVLLIFAWLLSRLLLVSDHLPDRTDSLIVIGVFGWLGAHVFLNVGAMIGLIPLTGITLPLLSFGGTSMIFMAAALGLAFQLSHYTTFSSKIGNNETQSSQRRRGVGRTRYTSGRRSS